MSYIQASAVMDDAAVLLNDTSKSLFSYAAQLPYLKLAYRDMDQELTLNEIPINLVSELEQTLASGTANLPLPTGFFLPISLQEKGPTETNESYRPIEEKKNINDLGLVASTTLGVYDFRHNCINFIASSASRKVRLYYWRTLAELIDQTSFVEIRGGQNYLAYRTAALCAQYIGGNATRAQALSVDAVVAMDRIIAIMVKNNQHKRVRRRPFRSGVRKTLLVR